MGVTMQGLILTFYQESRDNLRSLLSVHQAKIVPFVLRGAVKRPKFKRKASIGIDQASSETMLPGEEGMATSVTEAGHLAHFGAGIVVDDQAAVVAQPVDVGDEQVGVGVGFTRQADIRSSGVEQIVDGNRRQIFR